MRGSLLFLCRPLFSIHIQAHRIIFIVAVLDMTITSEVIALYSTLSPRLENTLNATAWGSEQVNILTINYDSRACRLLFVVLVFFFVLMLSPCFRLLLRWEFISSHRRCLFTFILSFSGEFPLLMLVALPPLPLTIL